MHCWNSTYWYENEVDTEYHNEGECKGKSTTEENTNVNAVNTCRTKVGSMCRSEYGDMTKQAKTVRLLRNVRPEVKW